MSQGDSFLRFPKKHVAIQGKFQNVLSFDNNGKSNKDKCPFLYLPFVSPFFISDHASGLKSPLLLK